MAFNWLWKDKLGTVELNKYGEKLQVSVYEGNCLCVMIYHYELNGKPFYNLYNAFLDIETFKQVLGLKKNCEGNFRNEYKDEWLKWRLNTYCKTSLKLAKILTQAGIPVELYYEKIK